MNTKQVKKAIDDILMTDEAEDLMFLQDLWPSFSVEVDLLVKVGNNTWYETRSIQTGVPNELYRELKKIKAVKTVSIQIL